MFKILDINLHTCKPQTFTLLHIYIMVSNTQSAVDEKNLANQLSGILFNV
jgi:hypothetical protein